MENCVDSRTYLLKDECGKRKLRLTIKCPPSSDDLIDLQVWVKFIGELDPLSVRLAHDILQARIENAIYDAFADFAEYLFFPDGDLPAQEVPGDV